MLVYMQKWSVDVIVGGQILMPNQSFPFSMVKRRCSKKTCLFFRARFVRNFIVDSTKVWFGSVGLEQAVVKGCHAFFVSGEQNGQ